MQGLENPKKDIGGAVTRQQRTRFAAPTLRIYHVPEKGNAFSSRGLFVVCVRGCGSKIAGSCAATPGCCARHPGACRTKEA